MDWLQNLSLFGGITVVSFLRYLFFAGIAWWLAYKLFKKSWHHRKIIPAFPSRSDAVREFWLSVRSVVIFGMVGLVSFWGYLLGWTKMYLDFDTYPVWWFFLSIIITIFIHDAWFYWTHRLMHHKSLFSLVHRTHHLSKNPTPWAAFAFSPLEAFIQAGIFPLTIFLIPIHPIAFGIFLAWQMFFNVIGHTGFEYNPRWFMKSPIRFLLNTPTNHVMHHEHIKGNYGLYFNFWDRIMRTNHQDYEKRFVDVTSRPKQSLQVSEKS